MDCAASTPVPSMLVAMLRAIPELLPTETFKAWQRYTLLNLAPKSELSRFNKLLWYQLTNEDKPRDNPSARDIDAEQHWLELFNQGAEVLDRFRLAKRPNICVRVERRHCRIASTPRFGAGENGDP